MIIKGRRTVEEKSSKQVIVDEVRSKGDERRVRWQGRQVTLDE